MDTTEIRQMLDAFGKTVVSHKHYQQALDDLLFTANFSLEVAIITLTGPTGAGKSTLLEEFCKHTLKALTPQLIADPSMRPIGYVTATAGPDKRFDWTNLYLDTIDSFKDPFKDIRFRRVVPTNVVVQRSGETFSQAKMRWNLEELFCQHKTLFWIIDEAHRLLRGGYRGTSADQCDVLQSMGQKTSVRQVLCGPPDLPDFMSLSGQLSRRGRMIGLHRYLFHVTAELQHLANVMTQILNSIPSRPKFPMVKDNINLYYKGCLGCVGVFKDWVAKAYAHSLSKGKAEVSIEDFHLTRMSAKAIDKLNGEIFQFEELYRGRGSADESDLDHAIFSPPTFGTKRKNPPSTAQKTPRPPPGERKPGRDAVADNAKEME